MKEQKNQCEDTRFPSTEQGKKVLKSFRQQLKAANRTDQTVKNYTRSIEGWMNYLETSMKTKSIKNHLQGAVMSHETAACYHVSSQFTHLRNRHAMSKTKIKQSKH